MNNKLKAAVLSLSLITVLAGAAVSPALGAISLYFNGVDLFYISMLISLPSLFIAVTSIFMTPLLSIFTVKKLSVFGLLLYLFGGLGGAFCNNILTLLIFRSILGIGTGIIMPLSLSLIAFYSRPDEQKVLMGYSVALNNLGGIIAMTASGFLLGISWRMAFSVYLIGLIPLILVILFIPDVKMGMTGTKNSLSIFKKIWPYVTSQFLIMLTVFIYISKFSIIMTGADLIQPHFIGIIMGLNTLTAMLIGYFFGTIFHKYNYYLKFCVSFSYLFGFLLLSFGSSVLMMILATMLIGIGNGIIMPLVNLRISNIVSKKEVAIAMSMNSFFLFLGQFCSPFLISILQSFNKWGDLRFPFYIGVIMCFILAVVLLNIDFNATKQKHLNHKKQIGVKL